MDALKSNPFLTEVESLLKVLGIDVNKAKQVVPNGILFYFSFKELPVYVCLPSTLPSDYSNTSRIEVEVACLDAVTAGHLIYTIGLYLDMNDCSPIRVIPRTHGPKVKIIIQFVCNLLLLQPTTLAETIIHCCDLSDYIKENLIEKKKVNAS